jgi:hypothetical protein
VIFLLQYDRAKGQLVGLRRFDDEDRAAAETTRFALELANARSETFEVVLLEAISEEALRRTHRRYFETLQELAEPASVKR